MLTWNCDICGRERPDWKISLYKVDLSEKHRLPPGTFKLNIKYCNDRQACFEGAKLKAERFAILQKEKP